MTNKKLPDPAKDKKADRKNGPADLNMPEMGASRAVNQGGSSNSHPEANDERRELTRKSDPEIPNPGRDITSGSDGFDGQGRERDGDQDGSVTSAVNHEQGAERDRTKNPVQGDHGNRASSANKA